MHRIGDLHEQLHIVRRIGRRTALRRRDADGDLHNNGYGNRRCCAAQLASDIDGELKPVLFVGLCGIYERSEIALVASLNRCILGFLVRMKQFCCRNVGLTATDEGSLQIGAEKRQSSLLICGIELYQRAKTNYFAVDDIDLSTGIGYSEGYGN
jgi:hypothetical protein